MGYARRNPACDVDKMPSPNFILTPSKDALGSYRESNPSNFLCVSVFYTPPIRGSLRDFTRCVKRSRPQAAENPGAR